MLSKKGNLLIRVALIKTEKLPEPLIIVAEEHLYARASLEICFLQTSQWCSLFSVTVVTGSSAGVLSGYA